MLDNILLLRPLCQDFVGEEYYVEKNFPLQLL